jgi:hypothetical protein
MRTALLHRPGSGLLAVSFSGVALGALYLVATRELEVGTMAMPGPGFFPVAVGTLFVGTAVLAGVEAVAQLRRGADAAREPVTDEAAGEPVGSPRSGGIFAALVAAFVLLLPLLGQYVASVVFAVAAIRLLGHRSWGRTLLVGVIIGLIISALFVEILGVPMPTGVLGLGVAA